MSFSSAISDFVHAIYEALAGTIHLVFRVVHDAFMAVYNFVVGCFTLVADVFRSAFALVGGVGHFVVGNFVILAIIAAGAYFYFSAEPQQQAKLQSNVKKAINGKGGASSSSTNGSTYTAKTRKA
ncbi:hypothetical protein SCUCBS95973_007913 [Sporothrix curviconia]|uniref:Uncharacterized protein n=1 Tax=Sporothrix curviconia TaxID=1260050 RepID=A0ABP0CH89_9PEZI